MTTFSPAGSLPVRTQGDVAADEVGYARTRIDAALRDARDPVLAVRARLTRLGDPAVARPAVVQVTVDLDGRVVRAQAARETMREAVDEVHDRLRDRVQRAAGDWEAIRGARPTGEPHEWRHVSAPADRPPYFPRPAEERRVVRHKAFGLARMTVDEAAFDMEMLDYRFHLFVEEGSGVDSVLFQADDGYRLAQLQPRPDRVVVGRTPFTVSAQEAPELTVEQARERMAASGEPFLLFRDPATGRGGVLYHRYDGHYGLITPAG